MCKLFETLTNRFLNSVRCAKHMEKKTTVPEDIIDVSLLHLGTASGDLEKFLTNMLGYMKKSAIM